MNKVWRRRILLLAGLVSLLLSAGCSRNLQEGVQTYLATRSISTPEIVSQATRTISTPEIVSEAPAASAHRMLSILQETELPQSDLAAQAQRLAKVGDIPEVVRDTPYDYQLGDREDFWASNTDTNENFELTAVLEYVTPHLYIWVEEGATVDLEALKASADRFEAQTYPTNRRYFGDEWSPGVDSDVHLNILHARNLGDTVGGYYSSADEFSQLAHPYSNECEMFYVNLDTTTVGGDYYDGLLAHEFQHMIHWRSDRNEDLWLNEGMSELAAFLNGFDPGSAEYEFLAQPDLQLNDFDYDVGSAHYGASYLFCLYFLERFGDEATQALIANPANGARGIDAVLEEMGESIRFEELFADWAAAVYLDRPELGDGRYGFQSLDPPLPELAADYYEMPAGALQASVHQFGSDYIQLQGNSPITLTFTGAQQVKLLGTDPHDGQSMMWSNRGDDIATHLTRAFDLSGLETATLDYQVWYDIEEDWDYAYVEVSTDDGLTWDILPTPHTSDSNPTGNSYGAGYTGVSGGNSSPAWIHEQVDLSDYAGEQILLRFEYITDGAIHKAGLALDALSIPELNFDDSFESEDPTWEAAGFVRSSNVLPQEFILQLLELGDKPRIQRLWLDSEGQETWSIPLSNEMNKAVLIVSGATPVTLELARYTYRIGSQ